MGKLKAFIALVIIFGGIYIGWELIPPYFHNYEFQDDLDDVARVNSYSHKTDEDIKAIVIQKADNLGITLKEEAITVGRTSDGMTISVHYSVHVNLILHPTDLDFTANSLGKRI
ncbi:MAG TPA: hypothetical protein VI636_16365 [Candidatus Angelobacter sp.]